MYFPTPEEQAQAQPRAPQAAPQGQVPQMPPMAIPNASGMANPQTGQHNQYAPIPPDEVKRWAEMNHVSKGSVKQVEWSQNAGKYVFTMKDGTSEQVDPAYILQNQGHAALHPDHLLEGLKFIMGRAVKSGQIPMPSMIAARNSQRPPIQPGMPSAQPPSAPAAPQPPVMPQ